MKKILSFVLSIMLLLSCLPVASAAGAYDENGKYVYRYNTFDFELIGKDPQHITDEEFFGVWDEATQTWTKESYFKYGHEDFPGLAPIEAAAKSGDYATAKKELMEYYVGDTQLSPALKEVSASEKLEGELQSRNMYASSTNGTPLAITDWVTSDWSEISVSSDVLLSYVQSLAGVDKNITFVVASMDKSNTPAEIKSKESGTPAVLKLVIDGEEKICELTEDSYISPGDNAETNYGSATTLYAQEHGYVGHWSDLDHYTGNKWNSTASLTKRTYLKFDLSGVSSEAKITSASLIFNARTASGGDLTQKELFVYGWEDSSGWNESTITWDSFTDWFFFSCNDQETWSFITHNQTTWKEKICYFHRGGKLTALSTAYVNSKEEKYAYTFLRALMSTVTNVGSRDKILEVMNRLDTSNHVHNVGSGFRQCWTSEYMTPEIFTACLKHFYIVTDKAREQNANTPAIDAEGNTIYVFEGSNDATNLSRMTYYMCTTYPELKESDNWYKVTVYSNKEIYSKGRFPDGVCIEQGMGYIQTFMANVTYANNLYNPDGYYGSFTDAEGAEYLRQIMVTTLASTSWDYGEFDLGDSNNFNGKSWFKSWYKILNDDFNIDDPNLKYVATDGKEGEWFDFTSNSFPYGLRTYMRTGWTKDDIMLAFTNKGSHEDYGESHGHRDQMHIVLKAFGQDLLVDSYGGKLVNPTRAQEVHPSQHNTITVNGGTHTNVGKDADGNYFDGHEGVEKEQEINDIYNFTTYSSAWVEYAEYAERNVLFLKNQGFFIVSDYVKVSDTSKTNTITQHWHMDPNANIKLTDNKEFRSDFESGANVILSPVGAGTFSNAELVDSKHGMAAGVYIDTQKGIYERETSDTAKFGTVIFPLREGDDRTITTEEIDVGITNNGASAFKVIVTDPETENTEYYYYYHLSDLTQNKAITIGDYTTDATSLLIQEDEDGNVVSFFVYDGSYIEGSKFKDTYLLKSTNGNVTIAVELSSDNTAIISSDAITADELENITVRTGGVIESATFNGDAVPNASKDGAYMYFGDAPIVNCTEFEEFYPNFKNKVLLESLVFDSTYETSTLGSMVVNETFTDEHGYDASYTDSGIVITRTKDGASSAGASTQEFSLNLVDYYKDDVNNTELYQQGFMGTYAIDITFNSNMTPVGTQTGKFDIYLSGKLGGEYLTANNISFRPKTSAVTYISSDSSFSIGKLNKGKDKTIRLVIDTVNDQINGFDVDTSTSPYTYTHKGKSVYKHSQNCESITSLYLILREFIEKDSTFTFKKIDIYEVDRKESCVDALPDCLVGNPLQAATEDITIPADWEGYTIVSSNPDVLGIDGKITRGTEDEKVSLTVSGNKEGVHFTKTYNLTVKAKNENDPNYIGGNLVGDYDLNADFAQTDLGKMIIVEKDTENHSYTYTPDGVTVTRIVDGTDDSTLTPALALNFATMKEDEANKTKLYSQSLSGIYAFDLTFNANLEGYGETKRRTDFYYTDTVNGSQLPSSNNLRLYTTGNMNGSISYDAYTAGEDKTIRLVVDTVNKKVYSYDVITGGTKPAYIYKSQNTYSTANSDTIASLMYCTRNYLAKDSSITFKNLKIYEIDRNEDNAAIIDMDSLPEYLVEDPNNVTEDIVIPTELEDYTVESSDTTVLKANGELVMIPADKDVSLIVSGTKDGISFKKVYDFTVKADQRLTQGTKIGDYDLNDEFAQTDMGEMVIINKENHPYYSVSYTDEGTVLTRIGEETTSASAEHSLGLNLVSSTTDSVNNTVTYQSGFSGIYAMELTYNNCLIVGEGKRVDWYYNPGLDGVYTRDVNLIRVDANRSAQDTYVTMRLVIDTVNNRVYRYSVNTSGETPVYTLIDSVDYKSPSGVAETIPTSFGSLLISPRRYLKPGSYITFKNLKVFEIERYDEFAGNVAVDSLVDTLVEDPTAVTDDIEIPAEWSDYTIETSDETVIAPDGTITRGTEDKDVTVTVSGSNGNIRFKKVYNLTVKAKENVIVTEPTLTVGDYTKTESTIDFKVSVASPDKLTGNIIVATFNDKTNLAKAKFYPVKSNLNVSVNSNNVKYIKVMWLNKETLAPITDLVKFNID